ncbi:MAG TPA: ergothioneine biosynthesis protein EgtB [Longimicrobiaceae bacterium]|nr:ergothioneine biosynthesis protein EgtB [Longimicrobiaceae bacterium]
MPAADAPTPTPRDVAALLLDARERTLLLVAPVPEPELQAQHDRLMSPVVWDLGHIAHFEELWLLRNLEGPVEFGEMPGMFNPFENPRASRGALALPGLADSLEVMAEVRGRVLDRLRDGGPARADAGLLHGGYVYHMVAQHEYQHNETILQALQLKEDPPYRAPRAIHPPAGRPVPADADGMVRFPGGRVEIGTYDRTAAYDNERPRHRVELAPFRIGAWPVTNGEYLRFMDDGGYGRRELWSDAGWQWRGEAGLAAPQFWRQGDEGWTARSMDRVAPVDPDRPVCHVCWYEAEAYARWAGGRLPTEPEWEAAACWDPAAAAGCAYPWGDEPPTAYDANLDQLAFQTAPVGAYPRNLSPIGCYGMIGDVWEWTASDFGGYPGFAAYPYREYSEVFFGPEHKVLRGGSWATRPGAVRATFRNWDYPIRRQIFSGFRIARDD